MLRIMFLTNRPYLPQKVGGAESSTHEMIEALSKRGNVCAVLSGLGAQPSFLQYKNRLKSKIFNEISPVDHSMGYPVYRGWSVKEAIPEIVEKVNPDVAILMPCDGYANEYTHVLAKSCVPTVLHLRDAEFDALGDPHEMNLVGVFSNSNFIADKFHDNFNIETSVFYNVFEREKYEVPEAGRFVTFINPVEIKGLEIALELARLNPSIPFLFVEGWQLKVKEKQRLFDQLKSLSNVKWYPRVLDMRKVYSQTRLLIVPSQSEEAWGRVVTEAHMSGIPVIASEVGGLPESVGPGGILVNKNDMTGWHDALNRVWSSFELWEKLSRIAKEYSFRAELSEAYIAERYEAALSRLVGKEKEG